MKNDLFAVKWNMKVFVGPLYMEKSCPGKEACHPSPVIFYTEHFYEKKLILLQKVKSIYTCHDCFVLTELTWLREPECLFGKKLAQLGWWPTVLDKSPWDSESITVIYPMCITRTLCSAVSLQIHIPYPFPTQYNVERSKELYLDGFNTVRGVGGRGVGTCSVSRAWIQFCVCYKTFELYNWL